MFGYNYFIKTFNNAGKLVILKLLIMNSKLRRNFNIKMFTRAHTSYLVAFLQNKKENNIFFNFGGFKYYIILDLENYF